MGGACVHAIFTIDIRAHKPHDTIRSIAQKLVHHIDSYRLAVQIVDATVQHHTGAQVGADVARRRSAASAGGRIDEERQRLVRGGRLGHVVGVLVGGGVGEGRRELLPEVARKRVERIALARFDDCVLGGVVEGCE